MGEVRKKRRILINNYNGAEREYYLVSICTKERKPTLWDFVWTDELIKSGETVARPAVKLSPIGEIVCDCWNALNEMYDNIKTDYYAIMPDHFHGILAVEKREMVCNGGFLQDVVRSFKADATRNCFKLGCIQIWQHGHYAKKIRGESDYLRAVEGIVKNAHTYASWHRPKR